MIRVESVTAAVVRPLREGVPAVHVLDQDPGAVHLGAFDGPNLVGVVSGFPIDPQGQPDPAWLQAYGPFGAGVTELVAALETRARVWDERRPSYTAADITVLTETEAIRKRPGMYIGSLERRGLEVLATELVSNVVDEHLAGHASCLWIAVDPVGITVGDDGRGLPPEAIERVCTELHAGSSLHGQRHHVHLGLWGLGLVVVNALSSAMVVTVDRSGRRYQQLFSRGIAATPLLDCGPTARRGTTVWFAPDAAIFGEHRLESADLRALLADLAVLNPGLALELDGQPLPSHGGLAGLARHEAGEARRELVGRVERDGVLVEFAVVWGTGEAAARGWANQLAATGSHVAGLVDALEGTEDRGRVALVSVLLDNARYAGRTKERLDMEEVRIAVRQVVEEALGIG